MLVGLIECAAVRSSPSVGKRSARLWGRSPNSSSHSSIAGSSPTGISTVVVDTPRVWLLTLASADWSSATRLRRRSCLRPEGSPGDRVERTDPLSRRGVRGCGAASLLLRRETKREQS
jgi:hypothetical protein